MDGTKAYLLAVVPVLVVATAAVWRPRLWQVALIAAGPLVTLAAFAELAWLAPLGWLATIGVAYATLTIPPVLPWRRRWARAAVPSTVLAICAAFVVIAEGEFAVVFYLALPTMLALGALTVLLVNSLRQRQPTTQ